MLETVESQGRDGISVAGIQIQVIVYCVGSPIVKLDLK